MKKIFITFCMLLLLSYCSIRNKYGIAPYSPPTDSGQGIHTDTISTNYAIYTLTNMASRKFMQVAGNIYYNEKYNDQSKIIQNKSSVTNGTIDGWQRWHVIYKLTTGGIKYYYIRNVFSGKLLDVPGDSSTPGIHLQQLHELSVPSDEQLWSFERIGGTQNFHIINKGNGMAVASDLLTGTDSIPVLLQPLDSSDGQRWGLAIQPVDSYRDDNVDQFFNRNNPSQGSVAFDQGNSIPLSWGANAGKVLWVTQDAWDGTSLQSNSEFRCSDFFQYRNSVLIQPSLTDWNPNNTQNITRTGSLQNRPKQICDIVPNTEYAWPSAGVEIGNHVYIQCGEGTGLGTAVSQSLYDLTENSNFIWTVQRTTPAGMTDQTEINYSGGMVKASDGFVYVYGTNYTGFGYTTDVHVARFPVTDPQSWTFWSGSDWVATPVTGTDSRIADGLGTATISFVNGKYVMITMNQGFNCDADRDIYASWSSSPIGPFSVAKKVYSINEFLYGSYARYYTPNIHPEFDNGRQELLVTYCLNFSACGLTGCKDGFQDPYFYRVKGIRIPYSLIGI